MKKLFAIISIAILLGSCAAEKRLALLLKRHPELQSTDTTIIHDTVILPQETNTTKFTLDELITLDSIAKAQKNTPTKKTAKDSVGKAADLTIPTVNAATDRSQASIKANGDKTFDLTTNALPDTIIHTDTVYQPKYITEYKEKEVEVYKQKWWQEILTSLGALTMITFIIYTIIRAITKYVKK